MQPPTSDSGLVLVAEDEPTIRLLVVRKLAAAGWTVVGMSNGEAALAAAIARPPRVVVTDYQMPILDGLALARALKAHAATSAVPVLLLTARGHRITAADLDGTNIQQVIMKPFSARELVNAIAEYCPPPTADADAA